MLEKRVSDMINYDVNEICEITVCVKSFSIQFKKYAGKLYYTPPELKLTPENVLKA